MSAIEKACFVTKNEKESLVVKKERSVLKRQSRHAAAKLVADMDKINCVQDIIDNYDSVIIILQDEIEKLVDKLRYCVNKDIQYAIKLSARHTKMTLNKKHLKGVQRFFSLGDNVEAATKWLFQRLISNIRNTHNKKYKKSLYFECEQYEATDFNCYADDREELENQIEIEKFNRFATKNEKIKVIKKVWKDAIYDMEFNGEILNHICKNAGISILEILDDEVEIKLKAEKTKNGNTQLVLQL